MPATLGYVIATPTELPREAPPHPSPRGGSPYMLCFRVFEWCSFPLGKAGMGLLCLLVRTPGNSYSVAVGCVPSTMYFGLKLHTENLIIIPHGMPWGIIVLILMTPALPCLLFPLIKFTNHGIKIHILRNFNPHFTEKCLVNVLLELPLWACHPRWIYCMLPSSACRHRIPSSFVLGNSVGVAISQPRVEVRSASTLGKDIKKDSNAVSVAISRRRYPQQDNCQEWVDGNNKIEYNTYG